MRHENLEVWKLSMDLSVECYKFTKTLPDSEKIGLISQIERCSVSIPSNLAEGANKGTNKEFFRSINIALGSLAELRTQLLLCHRLEYFKEPYKYFDLFNKTEELVKMMVGLKNSLKSSL